MNNSSNNASSTRAPPPEALYFTSSHTSTVSSSSTQQASYMNDYFHAYRTDSAGSSVRSPSLASDASGAFPSPAYTTASHYSSSSSQKPSTASSSRKNVNVYTTCGRHSNEWLFSGWPSPFKKRDGH